MWEQVECPNRNGSVIDDWVYRPYKILNRGEFDIFTDFETANHVLVSSTSEFIVTVVAFRFFTFNQKLPLCQFLVIDLLSTSFSV